MAVLSVLFPWPLTSRPPAAGSGSESGQHQLQLPDHGVGPLHLHPGEGGRAEPGGHRRPERSDQPDPPADHGRQRHHEPGEQSHRAERCRSYCRLHYSFMICFSKMLFLALTTKLLSLCSLNSLKMVSFCRSGMMPVNHCGLHTYICSVPYVCRRLCPVD